MTPAHPGQAMLSGPGIPVPQPCPQRICPQGSHTRVAVHCLTRLWPQVQGPPPGPHISSTSLDLEMLEAQLLIA